MRRSLRPELTAEQRELARRIRSGRHGSYLWRPLGVALMALAVVAAVDPDYPVARSIPTSASAVGGWRLLPVVLAPRGTVAVADLRFRWTWPGARDTAFELVVLDEEHEELARREVRGNEYPADAAMQQLLRGQADGQLHWFVVARDGERLARSAPMAFRFSR